MSISISLRRAAKLQAKIEALRGQLTRLLEQARLEVSSAPEEETTLAVRRTGRAKMFKSNGRRKAGPSKLEDRESKVGRAGRATAKGKVKRSPLLGKKRAASPSGPLAPAVVKVLRGKRKAMNVSDILNGLTANGYQFTASEPKKNLAARIYRLKGVKQVDPGLFAAI